MGYATAAQKRRNGRRRGQSTPQPPTPDLVADALVNNYFASQSLPTDRNARPGSATGLDGEERVSPADRRRRRRQMREDGASDRVRRPRSANRRHTVAATL